jgi:hypothetical protein
MRHLQERREDWESATDEEIVDAILRRPKLLDPFFHNWVVRARPHCMRRALLLHADLGGHLGAPALRFLRGTR